MLGATLDDEDLLSEVWGGDEGVEEAEVFRQHRERVSDVVARRLGDALEEEVAARPAVVQCTAAAAAAKASVLAPQPRPPPSLAPAPAAMAQPGSMPGSSQAPAQAAFPPPSGGSILDALLGGTSVPAVAPGG